jgi:erythrocyte band 7 integral membrane protein
MRQAADILSSAPAMQIRYLEAMQAMAKSANSKVIFLPGASSSMGGALNKALDPFTGSDGANGEHASRSGGGADFDDFGGQDTGLQRAINAQVVQNI